MARIRLPHNDLAAHARWLAETIVAPFTVPTRLPLLTKPPAPEPEPPQPTLFDLLAAMRPREPEAIPVAEDGECPACAEPGIWRLLKGVVAPPSPLALKRQRLKVEREEARAALAAAEAIQPAPEPEPAPDAMARLVASGIANEFIAGLGALRDPDAPFSPRSIGFPVTIHRVGGRFQPPTAPRIWELHLSTPACVDLPFVRRVEEVTGLKARWAPEVPKGMCGRWLHAVDLATDEGWERLASSMEHTTVEDVHKAVGIHVGWGSLNVDNARRLLSAIGIPEPDSQAFPNFRPISTGGLLATLKGWEAIHAVEAGLMVPGDPKRDTFARVTDAGWRSVGKEPPTKEALKAARKAARC